MDKVALLDASDRAALFGETGASRGVANTIIEKDFWVCWTLKRLFELKNEDAPTLIFKGGTSLSKAFGAIRRFSEDIDLSFDRADLGYIGDRDPEKDGISRKQAAKLIDDLVGDVEKHIAQKLMPALITAIKKHLGDPKNGEWSLGIDEHDRQTVIFQYPTALSKEEYEGMAYVTPRVKLEFGARGDPWPTEEKAIRPYAADDYPDFFEDPDCTITVLSVRRTFWEKVTALHAEAHRPRESQTPQYFARHYYDIAMLLDTEDGKAAATNFKLLERVAKHKAVFFRSAWANYDTARPGTLQLMPSDERLKDLRADYRDMAPMMFDDKPLSFDEILVRIQTLQDTINLGSRSRR
jgi:predicted nucleotidyltransferase component of viral defense system